MLLFGLLFWNPSLAASDWKAWERYMESGQRVLERDMDATAEYWFLSAGREAERLDPRDPRLAESLRRLVDVYRKQAGTMRRPPSRGAPRHWCRSHRPGSPRRPPS